MASPNVHMPLFSTLTTTTTMMILMIVFLNIDQLSGLTIPSNSLRKSVRHLNAIDEATNESVSDATARIDPLDNFNKYREGYDITNKHYWSSTAFTGIYGYAIAMVWLLSGFGYGLYLLTNTLCCNNGRKLKKKKKTTICHMQQHGYLWPIASASFFTILAIIGCGIVLGGNAKFHSKAKTIIEIIIDTADEASQTLYNTTGAMREMITSLETTNDDNVNNETLGFLITTSHRLDNQAYDIQRQAKRHRHAIDMGLKIVNVITTVTIALTLVLAIALSVFGILKLPKTIRLLIVFCWILTFFCWFFFGIYFFLEKFAEDTCTALEGFQKDPYNNSLSSILPCDELLSAKSVLYDVSRGISNLVKQVNRNITTSYGNSVQICNPFSEAPHYQYQADDDCPTNTIRIGDIPQVLKMLTCTDPACIGGILISTNDYNTMVAYTTSIQKILNVFPGMENLVECETVKEAFGEIVEKHCKPLKKYVHMEWSAMVFLGVVMVALVLIWTTIEAHHQQTNLHSLGGSSVKPHPPPDEEMQEYGTAANTKV